MSEKVRRFAVIGNPIAHSLSPQMHAAWIADHGLNATYERRLFEGDDDAFVAWARTGPFDGANVTVPFKAAARRAATRAGDDDVANVLTWREGEIIAANTDGAGFIAALDEAAPRWRDRTRAALIVGAGGGAAGVARALAGEGLTLAIVNRTAGRARDLAQAIGGDVRGEGWEALAARFAEADLIVQTTTLGMSGTESPAWPVERCKPGAIVVDIVYRPLLTPLIKAARARGLAAVDGLGMLIHQGALAFEMWFGVKPDTQKARARLLAILGEGS